MVASEMSLARRTDGSGHVNAAASQEWERVLGRIKDEVGEAAYRSWLAMLRCESIGEGEAVVAAPTRFLRNWVATHYADRLLDSVARREPERAPDVDHARSQSIGALAGIARKPASSPTKPTRHRSSRPSRPAADETGATSRRRSIRASPSTTSSSASPTNWPMPPPGGSPRRAPRRRIRCRSTRCSSMAASGSARPI